jgi:predicted ABC-type ATPase
LVIAGPNGAGKTTITERGLAHEWFHGCEYVNPDAIAQDELGDWNDPATVLRAAQLAPERREACLREGRSVAFETVFSANVWWNAVFEQSDSHRMLDGRRLKPRAASF